VKNLYGAKSPNAYRGGFGGESTRGKKGDTTGTLASKRPHSPDKAVLEKSREEGGEWFVTSSRFQSGGDHLFNVGKDGGRQKGLNNKKKRARGLL